MCLEGRSGEDFPEKLLDTKTFSKIEQTNLAEVL